MPRQKNVLQMGPQIPVNKLMVLILAIVCAIAGAVAYLVYEDPDKDRLWSYGFFRVSIVLTAFWVALPKRGEDAPWLHVSPLTLLGIILGLWATVRYPRTVIPIALMVGAVGYFLRPKGKQRPKTRAR